MNLAHAGQIVFMIELRKALGRYTFFAKGLDNANTVNHFRKIGIDFGSESSDTEQNIDEFGNFI